MISKSMHFGRMLPGRGPLSRIRRKRDAYGAILASQGPGADATREGDAGSREQRVGDEGAVGAGPGLGRWDESEAEERAES